jgi:hypothetical protein
LTGGLGGALGGKGPDNARIRRVEGPGEARARAGERRERLFGGRGRLLEASRWSDWSAGPEPSGAKGVRLELV